MDDWNFDTKKLGVIAKGSCPKFVLFLKGKVVDVIYGADTPRLEKSIAKFIPLEI